MHDDTIPPELAGYDPDEPRSTRGPRMQRAARIIGVIALVAMVLPGILVGISTATRTADVACRITAHTAAPDAYSAIARFDLSGAKGPGWYCYVTNFSGEELQLSFLGFIPEVRVVPGTPGERV